MLEMKFNIDLTCVMGKFPFNTKSFNVHVYAVLLMKNKINKNVKSSTIKATCMWSLSNGK